ncbi:MAG TPA: hypothetical protein VEK79_25985 [Thermoanaerobaculia bacterium]|nr:hypothetical protein [Thermoanaerobaculia bacterium]
MPCDHKGGPELIEMAEAHLRAQHVDASQWPGRRFRWSENLDGGMWASVIVEVERRGEQWMVTRLDRRAEPLDETGFTEVR